MERKLIEEEIKLEIINDIIDCLNLMRAKRVDRPLTPLGSEEESDHDYSSSERFFNSAPAGQGSLRLGHLWNDDYVPEEEWGEQVKNLHKQFPNAPKGAPLYHLRRTDPPGHAGQASRSLEAAGREKPIRLGGGKKKKSRTKKSRTKKQSRTKRKSRTKK